MKILKYFSIILTLFGCNQKHFDVSELQKYFQTDNITIVNSNNILEVTISNSKLLERKRELMRDNWVSVEPFSSVGAIIASTIISQNGLSSVDSIAMNLEFDGKSNKYVFSYEQVEKVSTFLKVCERFGKIRNKSSYESVQSFLSDRILKSAPRSTIEDFLNKSFLKEDIVKTELSGFKIANEMATLYVDYYYKSGPQTYGITFALDGDGKIAGIMVPE